MNRKSPPLASGVRPVLMALLLASAAPLLGSCSSAAGSGDAPHVLVSRSISPPGRLILASLFEDQAAMGETRAVIILRDGQPIYEAYGTGFGPQSKLISWSMAKSITAMLIGILVSDGRLVLDDPAPVPAWQRPGDPRGAITLRNLLNMASGLEHVEEADPAWNADTVAMLFGSGAGDMAAMAEAKPPVAQPNEQFVYSSATTVILSDIIARALTDSEVPAVRRDVLRNFLDGRLAGPLGMSSLTPEFDAHGTMIGGSIMHATARDFAKFGEFLRRGGTAPNGQRLVPQRWIDFMRTPSPANPGYGGHLWLNRPGNGTAPAALWPDRGPPDLFACIGHQGQFIIISPRDKLTVIRLGISTEAQMPALKETLRRAMGAI